MSTPYQPPKYILIGRVLKPHGVRGDVLVEAFTEVPERFNSLDTVYLSKKGRKAPQPFTITSARLHSNRLIVKFAGYNHRDQADELRGQLIQIPPEESIPLEEGEFFLFELHGMTVKTEDGEILGEVTEVIQTGANEVFVVNGENGEILIPDTEEVVLNIGRETREITVHIIPGLLE